MKFQIRKEEILLPLQHISKVATSKVIPILGGVLVIVNSERIVLEGGDSNNRLRYELHKEKYTYGESGSIVIPISTFFEIIRKMDGEMIEVELVDNSVVQIKSGSSHFRLIGMDASEYPEVKLDVGAKELVLSGEHLKQLINQTSYATSTREETPILTGVNLMVNNEFIRFTACDRHRLARVETTMDTGMIANMVISGKALNELKNMVKDEHPVHMTFVDQRVLFKQGLFTYAVTPLDGTYPDTEKMITMNYNTKATVSTNVLLRALERSMIISHNGNGFIISLQMNGEAIRIFCQSENGLLDENIVIQSLHGDSFEINFNVKYAVDALKTVRTEYTDIHYSPNHKLIIFKPHHHDNVLHLLMAAIK